MALVGYNSYEKPGLLKPSTNGRCTGKTFSVDMTKPMVAQVGQLGSNYDEWVHQPVKRKECPRLFENALLENFTKCKWWMIPLIWGPVVVWSEARGVAEGLPVKLVLLAFIEGLMFWTLLEYILHRWVFHMKASRSMTNKMHYIAHGFHHKHPMDGDRLVFPPVYTAAITMFVSCGGMEREIMEVLILWHVASREAIYPGHLMKHFPWYVQLFKCLDLVLTPPWKYSFFGGSLFGYIIYDLTHYFLHFGTPFTKHQYKMKKEHYDHHFKNGMHNFSFGVTSSFWDRVFGTLPKRSAVARVTQDSLVLEKNTNEEDNNAE